MVSMTSSTYFCIEFNYFYILKKKEIKIIFKINSSLIIQAELLEE